MCVQCCVETVPNGELCVRLGVQCSVLTPPNHFGTDGDFCNFVCLSVYCLCV